MSKPKTSDITDLQVVRACESGRAIDELAKATGLPEKVCWRALERALHRGLIDYGVSIACAWTTKKGKELLSANNEQA
jgi:hypothetical protein